MILEAFKIVSSVFPFLKEAFLWRDGAEEGKPITRQNLIRRKIAVFALLGSLLFNYFITGKVVEYYKQIKASEELVASQKEEIKTLKQENDLLKRQADSQVCMTAAQVYKMLGDSSAGCQKGKVGKTAKVKKHL